MNLIDAKLLNDIGIEFDSKAREEEFTKRLQNTLEQKVGLALVDTLDDKQAKELIELTKKDDKDSLTSWLSVNVPEYKQIVRDEYEVLLYELLNSPDNL